MKVFNCNEAKAKTKTLKGSLLIVWQGTGKNFQNWKLNTAMQVPWFLTMKSLQNYFINMPIKQRIL